MSTSKQTCDGDTEFLSRVLKEISRSIESTQAIGKFINIDYSTKRATTLTVWKRGVSGVVWVRADLRTNSIDVGYRLEHCFFSDFENPEFFENVVKKVYELL